MEILIKDEIKELIESYKNDFFAKTGLTLYAIEETGSFKISLDKIIKVAEEHYSVPRGVLTIPNRKASYVVARKAVIHAASDMGYIRVEVAAALHMDHATIVYHLQESRNDLRTEGAYKLNYMKFKEKLRKIA